MEKKRFRLYSFLSVLYVQEVFSNIGKYTEQIHISFLIHRCLLTIFRPFHLKKNHFLSRWNLVSLSLLFSFISLAHSSGRSCKQRLLSIEKQSMRSLSPDQTTRIITIYNSLKGNLQLTVNGVILADMFHFFSARKIPQLQEDMISEETKTKFSLPKSRKDFSHLIRGDLQKSKSLMIQHRIQ